MTHYHDHGNEAKRAFRNVEEFAAKFDDPSRDEWQKPDEIFEFIALKPGDKFADIGAGTGYFSIRAAKRLKTGLVYAIDSEPEMLKYIEKRAAAAGLSNIRPYRIDAKRNTLPEPVNVIMLVNTYHHIDDRKTYFTELKRWLAQDGKLVIIEGTPGTPMEPPEQLQVPLDQIVSELATAGYELAAESNALPYQSLQLFKPTAAKLQNGLQGFAL